MNTFLFFLMYAKVPHVLTRVSDKNLPRCWRDKRRAMGKGFSSFIGSVIRLMFHRGHSPGPEAVQVTSCKKRLGQVYTNPANHVDIHLLTYCQLCILIHGHENFSFYLPIASMIPFFTISVIRFNNREDEKISKRGNNRVENCGKEFNTSDSEPFRNLFLNQSEKHFGYRSMRIG